MPPIAVRGGPHQAASGGNDDCLRGAACAAPLLRQHCSMRARDGKTNSGAAWSARSTSGGCWRCWRLRLWHDSIAPRSDPSTRSSRIFIRHTTLQQPGARKRQANGANTPPHLALQWRWRRAPVHDFAHGSGGRATMAQQAEHGHLILRCTPSSHPTSLYVPHTQTGVRRVLSSARWRPHRW